MVLRSILLSLASLLIVPAWAQTPNVYDDDGRTLFSKEMYGGILLHGAGWGVHYFNGKYNTAGNRRLLGIEIVSMKHPKEVKSFNPYYEDARGYFYGKMNSMMVLRPSYGRKHRITEKIRKSGVELCYVWGIGPSIGLLKPVYLQIGQPDVPPYANIVVERYDPEKHFANNIFGRASWFRGLDEIKPYPGLFGRFAFNFEYAGDNSGIKALEVGAVIDAYMEELPIMAPQPGVKNKQIFFEFYLALQLGGKKVR